MINLKTKTGDKDYWHICPRLTGSVVIEGDTAYLRDLQIQEVRPNGPYMRTIELERLRELQSSFPERLLAEWFGLSVNPTQKCAQVHLNSGEGEVPIEDRFYAALTIDLSGLTEEQLQAIPAYALPARQHEGTPL